ncbi:MAG TPA: response regulator transcription factor [Puia sp.]|jgi:DNA-binding response OmpR family regulator
MKLLIIEDQKELSNSIISYLSTENYTCEPVYDYYAAIDKIHIYDYSCVVLDLCLPYGNGLDLLKQLKKEDNPTGVVIISAKNSIEDKVLGLNVGADDFLSKPFHLSELEARIASVIRRKSFDGKNKMHVDKLVLDIREKTLNGPAGKIDLTRMEYLLIEYFICNKDKVVTKEAMGEHLCGDDIDLADNYDFIYTHLKNLRRKLKNAGCPDSIRTVYGMGYKFCCAAPKD